jgi:thioredoxin 1
MGKFLSFVLLLGLSRTVFGSGLEPFDQAKFKDAASPGKVILVGFHSDSCGSCLRQKPILDSLLREPRFHRIAGFSVDIDRETELKKAFRVTSSSTLVLFRADGTEIARAVGITSEKEIRSLLEKGA